MTFGEKKEMEMKREETVIRNSSEEKSKFESFLGKQMLRVLLVEPDDSTRHIYALLLRNCNYRVTAVSDGLKAWETLKGRPHDVDLILTEVELPSISGYPLLTLIMEHDICKTIPVIMMSSKDSISLVLKCMLKGAVDFLIKPIRKSKLKNLWQHVWRRQINEARNVPECKDVALEKVGDDRANDYTTCAKRKKPCLRKNCSDSQTCFDSPYLEAETVVLNSASNIGEQEESAMPESESVGIASGAIDLIRNLNCCHEGLDDDTKKVNVSPDLKLSLKWMEPNDDRETLCHSKSSAFSTWNSNYQQSPAFCTSVPAKTQENLPTFVLGQSGLSEAPFTPIPVGYGYLYPPVYYMPLWNQKLHHEDSSFPTSSSVVHSTNLEQVHHSEDGKRLETERATSHRAPAHDLSSMKGENHVVIARPSESVNDKNHVLVHDGQQGKDSHTITPREAALIKFRLKRKDRCFEKKVRYQSRKRLADQRVRVKGQFIRQFPTENLPLEVNDRP